ncbi:3-(3-hydroxy-phenyl)propionate transporter MhpT [Pseudomonas alcaligenes]|uniref:3-(3-hydroxy-phenyl)propionate transporter MhpT n=1 Tax=Aquipseudomonas alcaligenes TaxID=43263 RepID=A0ABR7S291_AQUAC|nr:3-(3-hydroxy-phenyl)propionate transporter MhpT [Pseudomonas alcaligenes]MBC9251690.1 3-(3-hydroxy-phenyl)propionate transporter MhpT [Pseudomonas alcaligenes]
MTSSSASQRSSLRTIGLCFIVALLEGLDLQATGVAAPHLLREFALNPATLGWVFTAGLIGLLPGAVLGGWLADRYGRKRVLIAAVILFGLFSLLTAHSASYEQLLAARLVTGLGMGAALPILIALSSEVASAELRNMAVSLTYCGVPLGGAFAALIGMFSVGGEWRAVFYVGGVTPLLIAALLVLWLPESRVYRGVALPLGESTRALLGRQRGLVTLLLWCSCFCTLTILYMLLNWLPTLLIERGLSRLDTSAIQVMFNLGGGAGSLLAGRLMDKGKSLLAVLLAYPGMFVALAALATVEQLRWFYLAGMAAGACAVGGQLILYALAPRIYPADVRATGVGVAVAVGRLGSMSGPLLAGQLLAAGAGVSGLLLAVSPLVAIAACSAGALLGRRGESVAAASA